MLTECLGDCALIEILHEPEAVTGYRYVDTSRFGTRTNGWRPGSQRPILLRAVIEVVKIARRDIDLLLQNLIVVVSWYRRTHIRSSICS